MANDALGQIQAFRTRVTKLNANGVPSNGADKSYVSNALVTLSTSPVYVDGEDFQEKNGEGVVCVNFQGPSTFRRIDWTLTICTPDAYLMEMLTGGTVLSDGDAVGYAYPATGVLNPTNISIEVWTKRVNSAGNLDDDLPYAWWVLPRCKDMRSGSKEFGNNSIKPQISGQATENLNWFDGPTNDWPVSSDRVLQYMPCVLANVPDASTAYVTVAAS